MIFTKTKNEDLMKLKYNVQQINIKIEDLTGKALKLDERIETYFLSKHPFKKEIKDLNLFNQIFVEYIKILQKYYSKVKAYTDTNDSKILKDLKKEIIDIQLLIKDFEVIKKSNPDFQEYDSYINKIAEDLTHLKEATTLLDVDLK